MRRPLEAHLGAQTGRIGGHMTSMVDVVFLLVIFFMLVAQITRAEQVELELAQLEQPPPRTQTHERLAVSVVIPENTQDLATCLFLGTWYTADGEGLEQLTQTVRAAVKQRRTDTVDLRAPRNAPSERVFPVLRALSARSVDGQSVLYEVRLITDDSPIQ